jgi:hypothetical protein
MTLAHERTQAVRAIRTNPSQLRNPNEPKPTGARTNPTRQVLWRRPFGRARRRCRRSAYRLTRPAARANPVLTRQGFPGSHGPPEQKVNGEWLIRPYRWHQSTSGASALAPEGTVYGIELLNANEQLRAGDDGRLVDDAEGRERSLALAPAE